jgi:signal transduction histidine kinase
MPKVAAGVERADRRSLQEPHRLDGQLRQQFAQLARSHRYSLAGELAATIAHEINQPLGAILTNSETLEALLQSPAPDLMEVREIAADIRRDSQRAANVVRLLRDLLKESAPV